MGGRWRRRWEGWRGGWRRCSRPPPASPPRGYPAWGEDEERRRAAKEFGRRLERGDYGALFDGRLRAVMAQAATEQGLAEEIGALRVMLARLLTTEDGDPLRLAHGVARVAGVTVRAVRAQREIEGEAGDELTRELMRALGELDGEDTESGGEPETPEMVLPPVAAMPDEYR